MEVTAGIINILKVLSCMQILISILPAVSSQDPPTVTIPQKAYSTTSGQSVTLVCTVTADPFQVGVTWLKRTHNVFQPVSITGNCRYSGGTTTSPSLVISNALTTDGGTYYCTAVNIIGTGSSGSTLLTVSGTIPTVSIPTQTYATNPGENITMVCNVNANPTHTSVQWQKSVNGFFQAVNIATNSRYSGGTVISPSLVITGAVTGDTGTYRCTANNSVGWKHSRNTQLTITKSALTVTIPKSAYSTNSGGTVTLTCQISADPTYTSLHWLKLVNGNYQYVYSYENSRYSGGTFASPSLTISGALTTDGGAYLCAAANQFGTGTSVIQLSVSPVIPTVSIPTPTYATNSGGTITMVCNVNADPTHTSVSWEKNTNGVFQPVNIGGTTRYSGGTVTLPSLFIIGAVTGDTGTYRCTATNSVGTGTSGNTQLTITGSPPTVTQPLVSYSTTVGGTVTLVCSVNSTSNITNLYWEKQVSITTNSRYSGGTTTSPDFVITNAQTADAGTYRCSAANHYGTTYSQSTLLTVAGFIKEGCWRIRMSEEFQDRAKQYREMGKTAFIIGYTGECGKELVKALSKNRIFNKVVLIGRRKVDLTPDPGPEFEQKVIDYDKLEEYTEAFQGAQVGYCCLGTTRGKAGKEGFIKVDRDYVLKSAEIAKSTGCQHFSVVTASSANKDSMFLYVKTKGEVEHSLKQMAFDKLSIFKPAMLLCERSERRIMEKVALTFMKPWICMFPTAGSVPTSYVGTAMVVDTVTPSEGNLRIYNNEQIHSVFKQNEQKK